MVFADTPSMGVQCPCPPLPLCRRLALPRMVRRYGVYFCDCGTNRLMRKMGIRFETVDLGAYYASGTTTEDEYYLKITNMFTEFTTHVYVQGLPAIGCSSSTVTLLGG